MSTVAILGLGLIGGSLARVLAARGTRVIGYDRSKETSRLALESGVLSAAIGEDLAGLAEAATVVLAVPVADAPALLKRAAPRLAAAQLITDVGSTKRSICAAAEALGFGGRFVGSHPYAGDHRSGWAAARADLFEGATVFVCRLPQTTSEAMNRVRELWALTGAVTELIDPDEHDTRLALTSHLPQLVASATALTLAERELSRTSLGPGGRDATRLAGSDPELWSAIAIDNADNVRAALARFVQQLGELDRAIANRDAPAVRSALERAQNWFNAAGSNSGGPAN